MAVVASSSGTAANSLSSAPLKFVVVERLFCMSSAITYQGRAQTSSAPPRRGEFPVRGSARFCERRRERLEAKSRVLQKRELFHNGRNGREERPQRRPHSRRSSCGSLCSFRNAKTWLTRADANLCNVPSLRPSRAPQHGRHHLKPRRLPCGRPSACIPPPPRRKSQLKPPSTIIESTTAHENCTKQEAPPGGHKRQSFYETSDQAQLSGPGRS